MADPTVAEVAPVVTDEAERRRARRRETNRALYQRKREAMIAKAKAWQAANAEHVKAYYAANREKIYQRAKDWAAANPERAAAKTRRWQAANPTAVGDWKKANPEAVRAIKQRRRGREAAAEGTHTGEDIKRIGEAQGWKCHWCAKPTKRAYHVDHIQPLSKGGSNWPSNLAITCGPCNVRKHAADPIAFAKRLGLLI